MTSITFNGITKPYLYKLKGDKRPFFAPVTRKMTTVPGKPGGQLMHSQTDILRIPVPIGIVNITDNFQQIKDEMASWLLTDEPAPLTFSDEPDRIYYALVENSIDDFEKIASIGSGTLYFVCPDPYKYGASRTTQLAQGANIITNNATADALPITTVNFFQEATYFSLIAPDGKFMLIGNPKAVDEIQLPPISNILDDQCSDLTPWSTTGITLDYGDNAGTMGVGIDGGSEWFEPSNYGDDATYPNVFHGPAIKRTLPQPLSDFRVELTLELMKQLTGDNETGRIELILQDINGASLAKLTFTDRYAKSYLNEGFIYAGPNSDNQDIVVGYGPRKYDWNEFFGVLVIRREEDLNNLGQYIWSAAIEKTDRTTGEHYVDTAIFEQIRTNKYGSDLGSIQLHISKYGSTTADVNRVHRIRVWKVNQITSYDIPALFKAGDELVINHDTGKAHLNGDLFLNFIDAGSEFFALPAGFTEVSVNTDDGNAAVNMEFQERWL